MPGDREKLREFDADAAKRVVRYLKKGVRVRLHALQGELRTGPPKPDVRLAYKLDCSQCVWARVAPTLALAFLDFNVDLAKVRGGEEGARLRTLAFMGVAFEVAYPFAEEAAAFEDQDIAHFIGTYALNLVWPYVRAEIQMLCGRLGLPPLTLPVLMFGERPATFALEQVDPEDGDVGVDEADGG